MDRTYNYFKLCRTYMGGSKKEQLKIFLDAQGIDENGVCDDSQINLYEFRRLVIIDFEDIIHVTFSRKIISEKFSYVALLVSLGLVLLKFVFLFFICFGLSLIMHSFFHYFKYREKREVNNYNVVMALTNVAIHNEYGLNMPNIE